jgi:membrane protein
MDRVGRAIEQFRTMPLRALAEGVIRGYREHEVLTFASAIAFQVLFALIPLALCGLGLLGGLGLQEQWTREWGPSVAQSMSPAAFSVLDATVRRVLGGQQLFWMTAGAGLAVWKVSTVTRAVMAVFDRIYGSGRSRSSAERLLVSLLLGIAVAVLLLCAAASVLLGDDLLRAVGVRSPMVLWLRWPLALAFLFAVVALLVALAPADRRPLQWVTFGSVVVVASWVGTSLVLGWYLTSVADYSSVFGALGTVVVLLTYLYAASAAILTGAEIDALVAARLADDDSGGAARADRRSLSPGGDRARARRTPSGAAAGSRRR